MRISSESRTSDSQEKTLGIKERLLQIPAVKYLKEQVIDDKTCKDCEPFGVTCVQPGLFNMKLQVPSSGTAVYFDNNENFGLGTIDGIKHCPAKKGEIPNNTWVETLRKKNKAVGLKTKNEKRFPNQM